MNKLQINLTLEFEIPKEKITIDSVLYTVNETSSKVSIAITKAFLSGFEEKAVEEEIKNNPSYVRNGHQPRERQIRASFGSFSYRLAQLYDSDKGKTIIPLKHKLKWPDYRRYMNESIQGSGGLVTYLSYNKSVNESKRKSKQTQSVFQE